MISVLGGSGGCVEVFRKSMSGGLLLAVAGFVYILGWGYLDDACYSNLL